MPLPSIGQLAWGTQLNAEITADENSIATETSSVTNHENNNPADPHGDRAYATALVSPITTGTNQPNGYVVLNGSGKIPLNLVPVGAGLTNWIDAVPDYNVPTGGYSDASASLNAALFQTNVNGGGIVYVGSGQFALASPLIIYPNTWLLCSPGAVFTRITVTTPPFSMIQNFAAGVVPGNGNIRITGGTWDIATIASSGCMFTFANADFILVEDCGVIGYPDGHSPIGRLFGCADVTLDNIQISASAPLNSGRANQYMPCFQVDELNITNCPGVPNSVYLYQGCSDIRMRGCSHRGGVLSDSYGPYSAWTSFCGSKGTIQSGNTHSNIVITECFSSGYCIAAIEVLNWSNLTCTGNFFTYPQTPYVCTWTGISAQITTFIFDVCSPRSYPPFELVEVVSTVSETTCCQFLIPANDWIPGTTGYCHHHSGVLSTGATAGKTVTFKIYVGTSGNNTDTLMQTIGPLTLSISQTSIPYSINHRGFDIDVAGNWVDCGVEFLSGCCSTAAQQVMIQPGNKRILITRGETVYITITATWNISSVSYLVLPTCGSVQRCNL